jgi:hypothetical protein
MTKQEEPTPSGEQPKFTPPPWRVEEVKGGPYGRFLCVVADANNRESVVQIIWHNTPIRPIDEANARLIAAAPALYEALRLHMQWIGPPPVDRESFDSLREDAWRKGRAALALVDGPQETK